MEYNKYIINIFERYSDLKKSNKQEFDNNDLWKIFEYYSCIKLSEEYKKPFYEYDDIDPTFKELNKMSRNDTGIDCSDLLNTIVQCKLRKNSLTWKECSTFFGSQVIFSCELKKSIVRWDNLIITRNSDCLLSENLLERKELFIDKPYNKNELITYCENLILNPPKYPVFNEDFKLRDYQIEAIDIIKNNKKNVIINLPTGTGKNSVIIYSMKPELKYLILVPRIILMDQLKKEIIKHNSKMKTKIQLIGDGDDIFDKNKFITICVFNSVHLIENYCMNFENIFIDEAHHINKPSIYYENEEENISNISKNNNDELEEYLSDQDIIDDDLDDYIGNESINSIDDTEDELINVKNYTTIIKSLVKYNNNIYLSATIDKTDNFEYYSKDIRNMIDLKYLCDYQIHIPIFNDDPTNKNICEHLLQNYRNIIIYCNSQKEGKLINKLMNNLQLNSSEYLDCNTPKKKRDNIIEKFKKGEMPFLVNVRILVEGFDAPITKGVCFLHLPTNKTTLIQIIGRCLRLHPTKTIANIILPFSSKEDEKNICNFLKVMAKNDTRIKKSFENKTLGGYISIENLEENKDIEFKYNMIYDSMGILQNGEEIWMNRLDDVKLYIDIHKKRPNDRNNNTKIRSLGYWVDDNQKYYIKKEGRMRSIIIYNKWTEFINQYKKYFMSNEEKWMDNLQQIINYINIHNKQPIMNDKNNEISKMGRWLTQNKIHYKNKKYIMQNELVYKKWTEIINDNKYKKYFNSLENRWNIIFQKVIEYINSNNKLPNYTNKNTEIKKLATWINTQKENYKNKECIISNEEIFNKWTVFINDPKYKKYFQSNEDKWNEKLQNVIEYININKKRPTQNNKDKNINSLSNWISDQQHNYKNKEHIMTNQEIFNKWTDFISNDKYKKYFQSNEDNWNKNYQNVIEYINANNERPSSGNKNIDIRNLALWINTQNQNYKNKEQIMTNQEIYNKWTEFINNAKYKKYFQSNEDEWNEKLQKVIEYININNKRPSKHDKIFNINILGVWITNQILNYKNKDCIMTNQEIFNKWTVFINDPKYKKYFQSNEDKWNENLQKVIEYININNKRPSQRDKNFNIKILGVWITCQCLKYKNKEQIMTNQEIYNKWNAFINDPKYKKYFQSNEEIWIENYQKVIDHININNKRPSQHDKNNNIKQLGTWISNQLLNHKNKEKIMTNQEIYNKWTEFINDPIYKNYF